MRILLYIVSLAAVLVIPNRGTDVGKLIPVEVIAVSESDGVITIRTDTGDTGEGDTIDAAIRDLKDTAPGVIYMDTAEYLLLEETVDLRTQLEEHLKGSVRVYHADGDIELDGISDYLSVHRSDVRLEEVSEGKQIPIITEENGRYRILKQ